jgi:hypothetical protein
MKKDKIKVYFDDSNKWYKEVYYLKPQEDLCSGAKTPPCGYGAPENFALGDQGIEQPMSVSEMNKMMFHCTGNPKFAEEEKEKEEEPLSISEMNWEPWEENLETPPPHPPFEYHFNLKNIDLINDLIEDKVFCCPVGPKGKQGSKGYDESKILSLIQDSLQKFSKSQINLSSDSAREVLADGIAKKITKYIQSTE